MNNQINWCKKQSSLADANTEYSIESLNELNFSDWKILLEIQKINELSSVLCISCNAEHSLDFVRNNVRSFYNVDISKVFMDLNNNKYLPNRTYLCGARKNLFWNYQRAFTGEKKNIILNCVAMYLNDDSLAELYNQVCDICEANASICICEPVGVDFRVTIREHFSNDIDDMQNMIYRSQEELIEVLKNTFYKAGYVIKTKGILLKDDFNNRRVVEKMYYVLTR